MNFCAMETVAAPLLLHRKKSRTVSLSLCADQRADGVLSDSRNRGDTPPTRRLPHVGQLGSEIRSFGQCGTAPQIRLFSAFASSSEAGETQTEAENEIRSTCTLCDRASGAGIARS
ncbi:UNVERIFIED_CONTAM: hypothetical protein HHA_450040 [Hammondia hammondi]|eukprot:XP_008882694.1 hypothetical protein HHA_450040 [Hammondia hammondi]